MVIHTSSKSYRVTQEQIIVILEKIATQSLMTKREGSGNVFVVAYNMRHLLEVVVFCFKAHTPNSAERPKSTQVSNRYR